MISLMGVAIAVVIFVMLLRRHFATVFVHDLIPSTFALPIVETRGSVVIILGARGFIGTHFVTMLSRRYDIVVACDVVRPLYLQPNVFNVYLDVLNEECVERLFDYCATRLDDSVSHVHIINVVGYVDMRTHGSHLRRGWSINVEGTKSICAAVRGKSHFLLLALSSASVYHLRSSRGYSEQKAAAEQHVLGVDGIVLRPNKVYGKGDYAHGTEQLLRGKTFPVIGRGNNQIRFCHVETLVEFALAALKTRQARGKVLFVGDEESSTLEAFCTTLSGFQQPRIPVSILRILTIISFVVDCVLLLVGIESKMQFLQLTPEAIWFATIDDCFTFEHECSKLIVPLFIPPFKTILEGATKLRERVPEKSSRWVSSRLFEPLTIGPLTLRNRCIKSATFEGMSGEQLVQFHRRVAQGGVAMTTVAYLAISADARSFSHQNFVCDAFLHTLGQVAEAVHQQGALISGQLTHAGFFSLGGIGPVRQIDKLNLKLSKKMSQADAERIRREYVAAALLLERAGFDAIEIHCGHGYLLSQFLHARKTSFVVSVIAAVREALGDQVAIIIKMNVHDGVAGGVDLSFSLKFALTLQRQRLVDAFVPSGGMAQSSGFYMLRGRVPLNQMISESSTWWMKAALYCFGWTIPTVAFRPLFFLEAVLFLRQSGVHAPIFLLGGISTLGQVNVALDEYKLAGVAMARALLLNPDLVNQWNSPRGAPGASCDHNNSCVVTSTFSGNSLRCRNNDIDW